MSFEWTAVIVAALGLLGWGLRLAAGLLSGVLQASASGRDAAVAMALGAQRDLLSESMSSQRDLTTLFAGAIVAMDSDDVGAVRGFVKQAAPVSAPVRIPPPVVLPKTGITITRGD